MRPAGCDLIALSDGEQLVAAIERRLREPRTQSATVEAGDQNLAAVLAIYREMSSD